MLFMYGYRMKQRLYDAAPSVLAGDLNKENKVLLLSVMQGNEFVLFFW